MLLDRPALWTTATYLALAGIGAGLIAAITGFLDYFFTVPPNSSGKRRATRAGLDTPLPDEDVAALDTVSDYRRPRPARED